MLLRLVTLSLTADYTLAFGGIFHRTTAAPTPKVVTTPATTTAAPTPEVVTTPATTTAAPTPKVATTPAGTTAAPTPKAVTTPAGTTAAPTPKAVTTPDEYCEDYCSETSGCGQSYCKEDGHCFGLYHNGDSKCYQSDDEEDACDDSFEPVRCLESPPSTCDDACSSVDGCRTSELGTYCKFWLDDPVCYGILKKNDGSLCFVVTDEACEGNSYPCDSQTAAPVETTEAPVETTAV
ncbi:conserved hypothetical protein [Perkinsus marinus ATCC 50983]|uniref:Merozoite surface protein 2 n=1 Tax=Perkinsus marinus (strain ATCC 50983 / TXsc) TaxID=423536 RepID=C5LRU8_PERM5|nr:conserved hypothetical protein [Perkinsus marinus ATCC 50983]EER00545.1 conserved hypothetical protein [Perkinsus marinus ATCC 50983]|eukprot:XP_002767827.1 conserved hypothetical protein [Perkinsus marinus ATCC 50983]